MIDFDNRPWGRWEEYLFEPGYRVKRIMVFRTNGYHCNPPHALRSLGHCWGR